MDLIDAASFMGAASLSKITTKGTGTFVVVLGLSRLVTSWPLKVGLVLQI